ncbi:hybrid sensor histidine kinase/response regulator [Parabacteroides pacaensis]|uniref:hybrid sensor histidine kinase/response regulator n=1 Tax=Parabacteroides pacaensis TaxID=2086575 RepID=UPI000D10582E|nr:response regulator [Parabacteroides pacaensis]
MEHNEVISRRGNTLSSEEEISELIQEQLLFTQSIYARLPIGIEIYDANGVLRSINNHALSMYGVENQETVINKVNLFDSPYVNDILKAKIQSGEDIVLEFEYDFDRINNVSYFSSHNHDTMIYEARVIAIRGKSGAVIGHILLANDVTAVKEAEYRTGETKKNLEMAMDAANMSSWVYDVDKKTFSTVYGNALMKGGLLWDELLACMHPQDRPRVIQLFAQLIEKEIPVGHITIRLYNDKEQQYRSYEWRMRLSEHFGKIQIVGTQLDVTERIQLAKKTQDLTVKRELAMKVSNIVHWDFDVRTQKFESYNDPINDYASERLLTVGEYMEVIHPEDRPASYEAIRPLLEGRNQNVNFTCRMQTKYDDNWQYFDIIGIPFERDEEGHVIRFTGFRQNIPKLQQLNRELKERNYKIELTFKTIGMSYWDFDVRTGHFKAFNDPVNDFCSEKVITPEDYLAVTHPDDVGCVKETIGLMLEGTNKEFNFEYRSKTKWDAEWLTLLIAGVPVETDKEGRVLRYTGIKIDNTKWEKMIRELKELKEKAELSDKLKSAFLANMSHEIRTPLNAIVGFSELMVNCDDLDEKAEYIRIIQSNTELLLRLIDDILDLSKIEAGILERKNEKFNLADICDELYATILPKVTNPAVEFRRDDFRSPCWVFLDKNRMKQVWMNFLTNAVKCTKSGYIKMGYIIEEGGIRIYVEDSGVGIPEELHTKVFDRFQKINSFVQGSGLGLTISKAIVESAGGKVGFTSTPGVGSTFWAWIPCEVNEQEPVELNHLSTTPEYPSLPGIDGKDLRILVVEDNDSNYLLVKHILKGYNLYRAQNGLEAVEMVRNGNFSLILMDIKMPVMDGLEATRKIREFNTQVLIVALTANVFDSEKNNALEAGCNAFLAKPFNKDQLFRLFTRK